MIATHSTPTDRAADARAIPRYPAAFVTRLRLADGRGVVVRPVLPGDTGLQRDFVRALSPLSRYRRFHGPVSELPEPMLRYLCEVDYVSHLALLATVLDERGDEVQVAEARWVRRRPPADASIADFALAVDDRWQGVGLGSQLLRLLLHSASAAGLRQLRGDVLARNPPMHSLLLRGGWQLRPDPDDPETVSAEFDLRRLQEAANDPLAEAIGAGTAVAGPPTAAARAVPRG